jgi:hypothetical protein
MTRPRWDTPESVCRSPRNTCVDADLCPQAPWGPPSPTLTIVEDATRHVSVYTLQRKSEAAGHIMFCWNWGPRGPQGISPGLRVKVRRRNMDSASASGHSRRDGTPGAEGLRTCLRGYQRSTDRVPKGARRPGTGGPEVYGDAGSTGNYAGLRAMTHKTNVCCRRLLEEAGSSRHRRGRCTKDASKVKTFHDALE